MNLSKDEVIRYSRQMQMPELGTAGQLKLKQSSVLIVGLGGLGSPAAMYLAAGGIGHIGLIDFDTVDVSNLQRQILYATSDSGKSKAESAKFKLQAINPDIQISVFNEKLTAANALQLFKRFNVILDGADNFATRYLTNDAAHFAKKTLISASVLGFEGQLSVFNSQIGPCYRCLYPEPPPAGTIPSCAEAGVFGAMAGIMGSMQALQVFKELLNLAPQSTNQLIISNAIDFSFTTLQIEKNPNCPLCGNNPKIKDLKEENFICATDSEVKQISKIELEDWQKNKKFNLLDVREPSEVALEKLNFNYHIPINQLEEKHAILPVETPLVVYCQSGVRSLKACRFLQSKGYHVFNLTGGLKK